MKKIVVLIIVCLLFGYKNRDLYINNYDYLSFEYMEYKVDTHFYVKSYDIRLENQDYVLKAITYDENELELRWNKEFKGIIEVKETIRRNGYDYTYYIKRNVNEFLDVGMCSDNVNIDYEYNLDNNYLYFDGNIEIQFNDLKDDSRLGYEFYINEDGSRCCDIDKLFYLNVTVNESV